MDSLSEKDRFIGIVKEYKRIIYKVVFSYCKDADDRKDLEQEIMIQLWQSLKNYDEQYKLSTWIYKICLNVAVSHYRKDVKRKQANVAIDEAIFLLADDDDDTEEQNRIEIINDFIYQLDVFNKALMILYLEDNSYKEIANFLGITETNVGTKINRIKKQLKEYVQLKK